MQLRRRLMAASCALLGATGSRAQQPAGEGVAGLFDDWSLDTALAYYHESGRIQAVEPLVAVGKTFADGATLGLNGTFDVLSGASPNGALTSRSPQTFASPSGTSFVGNKHTYTTNPGEYPVDPHYQDDRLAVGADLTLPVTRLTSASFGGKLSDEHDFLSVTANASVAHDFNEKNTTLSLGVSNEYDRLNPIGGAPVPGSDYALLEKTGGKTKDDVGALFGVTQVMASNWIAELNLSADRFKGYLNDPYKITSILDPAGGTAGYAFESRPDQRTRKSAYLENRAAWGRFSANLALRYMQDDWRVRSDTAELHLRWTFADRNQFIEPSFRWYRQTAAYFYAPWLASTATMPQYQSSDERLDALRALTYGIKYEHKLAGRANQAESELSVRLEYYHQNFAQPAVPAALQGLDMLPPLRAVLLQVGWRF